MSLEEMEQVINELSDKLDRVTNRIRANESSTDERIDWLESRLGDVQRIAEDARYAAERR